MQKRLLANGVLVSNGRLKGPEDDTRNCPDGRRVALNGIRLGACASSLAQGRHWETGTFIFRATPGRVRESRNPGRAGVEEEGESPGPLIQLPQLVGIRGCEQNHLWDICEGSRALEMPTERQKKSFTHAFIPQSLL